MRAVVVGGSVAGVAACAALREEGFDGEVVLVCAEAGEPYDRPPLSKQLLTGAMQPADIVLPGVAGLDVVRRAGPAVALDAAGRRLTLADGEALDFDGAILATGSAARRLPGQPDVAGIQVLRTLDDALALRELLVPGARVVVIGAGFIGLEVASSARELGCDVTVLEAAPSPMARIFREDVGGWFTELHAEREVRVRCGTAVEGFDVEGGRVTAVRVAGGPPVAADVVVVGVGAAPVTDWLEEAGGVIVRDGVVCDAYLRAGPRVWAAGDVARWDHPLFGSIRVEHWTTAGDHARTAAHNLVADLCGGRGGRRLADEVPYFWSDQAGVKVQMAGWVAGYDDVAEVREGRRRLALFAREGRLVAALTWSWPAMLARQRRAIAARTGWAEAVGTLDARAAPASARTVDVDPL